MMILAYYIFIGLLSSTSGQTVVISLSNGYVNKPGTVNVTCAVVANVISDIVEIYKDGIRALRCPSPPVPCSSTVAAYRAVQDETAGTTTMTISTTDISRDTGNWTCQHGGTSSSNAASLTVGTPVSITKMNELNTTAVIETSCTFPYADVNVSCSVSGTDINCQYNISSSATCSDLNERVLTVTIYLDLYKGPAFGFLTVLIDNGFTAASKTGSRNYTFAAKTTRGITNDNSTDEIDLKQGLGTGLSSDTICVICLIFIVKLITIDVTMQAKDELQKPKPKGSEVTITASFCGFWISSVHWTGPQGNTLTAGKYKIQYNEKTGISTLKITNLEINDSGLYTCHANYACGSSAQDSVKLSVYEKLAVDIDIGETFRQYGSDVKIICSVYGSENKSVDWTGPEEKILINGGRYTIASYDSNINKSSLIIRTSSMTKAEGYICHVAFKDSGVSVRIYITITVLNNGLLTVIEKIILSVPASENVSKEWIGLPRKTLTNPASENETIELTGLQENILTNTGKYTIVPYDRNTNKSHLTVKNFFMNDHGCYTCQAIDSSGSPPKISITITTNDSTDSKQGASKLILGLGFGIICVVCIACIVILVTVGKQSALKLGLGLGLGLGIPIVGCIIVIVILVKKVVNIQAKGELQKPILEGSEVTIPASVHGFCISSVQWIGPHGNILTSNEKYNIKYNRDTGISTLQISALEINDSGLYICRAEGACGFSAQDSVKISVYVCKPPIASENRKTKSGSRSDVSRNDVEIQMEEKGVKSSEKRHPATENKVKSETTSKKTNDRPQPLPPVTIVTKDIPKPRPQPPPPENSDVENRNLRGISANFDDSRGLPTDIPQSGRLPPIPQKQPTVQEEDASEKPKQKKNKKKKKGKVKEGNPEEEMIELKSKRKLPEDQSDED